MIKEIKYNGYTESPSDLSCPDGDLATAINVIQEDGSLRPIHKPKEMFGLSDTQEILFIHKDSDFCNYIIRETSAKGKVSFRPHNGTNASSAFLTLEDGEEYVDINAIGRMLVVSTSLHLHYIRYKDGKYIYLGTQVPDVRIDFGLDTEAYMQRQYAVHTLSDNTSAESSFTEIVFSKESTFQTTSKYTKAGLKAYYQDFQLKESLDTSHEYKIGFLEYDSNWNIYTHEVYGVSSDGFKLICRHKNPTIFSVGQEYSTIRVVLYIDAVFSFSQVGDAPTTSMPGDTIDVLTTIYKGLETTSVKKKITYDAENYEAVMGAVNSFVNTNAIAENKFIHPFFVRYAVRMSDGTYTRASDPILLIPNSGYAPLVRYGFTTRSYFELYSFISELQYKVLKAVPDEWTDVIAGVDIFVSQPAYPYKQGENFDGSKQLMKFLTLSDVKGTDYTISRSGDIDTEPEVVVTDLIDKIEDKYDYSTEKIQDYAIVRIAENADQRKDLYEIGTFYLVKSIDIADFKVMEDYQTLDMEDGTLSSLAGREVLTDNALSRNTFRNAHLSGYNQRLHLYDYEMVLATPTPPMRTNGSPHESAYADAAKLYKAIVYIKTSDGLRIAEYTADGEEQYLSRPFKWFYYPHNGAYKLRLFFQQDTEGTDDKPYGTTLVEDITLTQHKTLNGAYWLSDDLSQREEKYDVSFCLDEVPQETNKDHVYRPSSVLQSSVNSVFVFLPSLIATLGVQRIYNLSSAAKALSQGQFGQFPLYAFTTDGVWALEVASTGAYSSKQPISRDVCITPEAITQLDSEVIFPTDRGLMLIRGSEISCVSDNINSETPFDISKLPCSGVLHKMLGHSDTDEDCVKLIPFSEYLSQCRMMYDYSHQRIFVYAPGKNYAYVYSLKSQTWGMTDCRIKYGTNYYPEAIAVDMNNKVVNFSSFDGEAEQKAKVLYITRPLKLDAPFLYKTIDTLIQRGEFERFDIGSILYGSRDMINWFVVWSSKDHTLRGFRGTGYKYFRIAGIGELDSNEMVYGASIQFEPRETNQLR
jgi:hypothetical protein